MGYRLGKSNHTNLSIYQPALPMTASTRRGTRVYMRRKRVGEEGGVAAREAPPHRLAPTGSPCYSSCGRSSRKYVLLFWFWTRRRFCSCTCECFHPEYNPADEPSARSCSNHTINKLHHNNTVLLYSLINTTKQSYIGIYGRR